MRGGASPLFLTMYYANTKLLLTKAAQLSQHTQHQGSENKSTVPLQNEPRLGGGLSDSGKTRQGGTDWQWFFSTRGSNRLLFFCCRAPVLLLLASTNSVLVT